MKYSRNFLKGFEAALLDTKEAPQPSFGICTNLSTRFGDSIKVYNLLHALTELWPKYTRDKRLPVPGGYYYAAQEKRQLWDKSTQYGRNRYELLDFLIEQVQAMLQEIDDYIEEHDLEYLEDLK